MSSNNQASNKRLAKNTLFLYIRMLFLMIVTFYTSRVVLNALGVEDFGIYNAVAGFVAMFNLLSASITVAITRFITFELGKTKDQKLDRVFSSSVNVQLIMITIVVVIAETLGLWFLNTKMVIPQERMVAANYVYQATILTLAVNLFNIPYNAAIIAHEKMSAFAYIGIIDAVLKLFTAFALLYSTLDKLTVYAILTLIVSILVRSIYTIYCKRNFPECTYHFIFDREILKKMFSYAGWTYIGTSGALLRDQGGIILINLFFGPVINAARGISVQVQSAVNNFAQNFMTAINPQITKSYAAGDIEHMKYLISKGTRFGYYLVLLLSLPILFNTEYILQIWLKIVPAQTVDFVRLSIIFVLSESISNPLITAASASGKIRNYQLLVGGIQFANFPITWILFKLGYPSVSVLIVAILLSQCCFLGRLYILRGMISLSSRKFLRNSYMPILLVTVISIIIPSLVAYRIGPTFWGLVFSTLLCLSSASASIYYIGLTKAEKQFVLTKTKKLIHRIPFIAYDRN